MSLELRTIIADRHIDLAMRVNDGEVVAVLGPNGAGKSTMLELIAGLLRPDVGCITLGGRVLLDIDAPASTQVWVPPHDRGIALLAQDALLFPHLSVVDNVAFGPRSAGRSRRQADRIARRWLEEVGAIEYADRKPSQLSGGQAQRIAVARALAADPSLLLLDEPMAALDVAVAPALRQMLRRVLRGRTAVIVTHDVLDALLLADRVVVIEEGRVVEQGLTGDVLARPHSSFAARIAGLNLLRGTVEGSGIRSSEGLLIEGLPDEPVEPGQPAVAVFRPSAVGVYRTPPGGSPRNVLSVRITELEPRGDQVRVRTARLSADVTVPAVAELELVPGARVLFAIKASEVSIYPI